MIAIAMLVALQLDIRFQTAIASDLPGFLTTPAQKLQENRAVARALAGTQSRRALRPRGGREARYGLPLPVVGPAPEFVGTQRWFNTPGGARLTMRSLRGRVVLIDFWTYTCINCIRTFPHLRALDRKYRPNGLTIVGVHSPEFPFEKDAGNVAAAIRQNALTYPVAQDNDHATWDAYANQYYPADYLVDAQGRIRYVHFAEGDYETGERAVRALLAEAGRRRLGGLTRARVDLPSDELTTPESPLGAARGKGFINGRIHAGRRNYGRLPRHLPGNALAYAGRWSIGEAAATAEQHARLALDFTARRVFLVLGSPGRGRRLRVLLDGRPIPARAAGDDVRHGALRVRAQRLYRLVSLPRVEHHRLTVEPQAGISAYAFTFG
jgi:thiol-disulfide isomerase/thioredoxin